MEEEKKNWLEPTEVLEYSEELGEKCLEDPENDWSNKLQDGVGKDVNEEEAQG